MILISGRMLSGDCNKNIFLWQPTDSSWVVAEKPFIGHTASVEDIKWSPKENNVGLNIYFLNFLFSKICMVH